MKRIPIKNLTDPNLNGAVFKTVDLIKQVISVSAPNKGIDFEAMRGRLRVLEAVDALEADAEVLPIEDADHSVLAEAVKGFQFRFVSKALYEILDDIVNAKKVPK